MNETKVPRFVRIEEVKRLTGLSRSSIYARADFPQPVKLGARAVAWVQSEIDQWIEQRIAASRDAR